jgi:hypothetical protein
MDAIDASLATVSGAVVQTTTSTGTVNDFALTSAATLLRCNNATALTLTGLATGADGQRLDIVSIGAGTVALTDQGAGSTAGNRLITGETGTLVLPAGTGRARLVYDATTARWRVLLPVFAFRAAAYNSAAQSINDATFTLVTFDTEDYDVGGLHSTVTNTSRFTIPTGGDGTYRISAVVAFAGHATGQRIMKVIKSGADFTGNGYILGTTGATWVTGMSLTVDTSAVAGDYFELHAYQNSGAALNIGGAISYICNRMQIARIA